MPATIHPALRFKSEKANTIWRYMDIAKFHSLLATRSLWLSRRDLLGDPFEGSIPRWLHQEQKENDKEDFSLGLRAILEEDGPVASSEELGREIRRWHYVNCWNRSASESMALWQLYGSGGHTVAIKSTLSRLVKALQRDNLEMHVVPAEYLANDDQRWNELLGDGPPQFKHVSYRHEAEVRIVHDASVKHLAGPVVTEPIAGLRAAVELKTLVTDIVVGPNTPSHFVEAVRALVAQDFAEFTPSRVTLSEMHGEPFF